MSVEYVKDPRTGQYRPKGSLGAGTAVVPERPPAPKPKAKPKPKPQGFQVWGMGPGGFSPQKLLNDLQYELKSGRAAAAINPTGSLAAMPARQAILGATTAATNAGRNIIEMKQKAGGRPKGDYTTSPAGRVLDRIEGGVFKSLGEKDPAQMTPQEKGARDLRSSLTLAVGAGLATGPALGALAGVRFIGPAAQAIGNAISVSKATTPLGAVGRLAADTIVGEIATTPFDDNTGGSAAGLLDMVLGTKLDPVKPGMDRVEAAAAAFLPNLAAGGVLGGALVGAPKMLDLFGGTTRARSAKRTVEPIQAARSDLEGAGMTQSNPETSAAAFTPDAADPRSELAQANAALEEKYGIAPVKAPEPEPAPAPAPTAEGAAPAPSSVNLDQWEIDYDPALPEADVALSFIRNSSDAELLESVRSGGPVLDVLDEQVAARAPGGPDPSVSLELSSAPSQVLADPVTPFGDQWKRIGQKDPQQLLSVMHPDVNPDLAARAKTMFGREWEELTVDDAVETLKAAAADGTTVIPNRLLQGQQIMKPDEIKVDPQRFQYKGGIDAQGVQKGSSLQGVDRWNTDMENVIEVWQDPADGAYYVVNGHNRLAKAKELGIKSLVVKEIIADTAEQAKTIGALSNIASGGGKPIDAARFMKGAGVTDPAQLEAMGVPLSPDSGHGLSGFQLSQLPEDVLQAVESGQVKERMGRIIGGSGADEESMRAAYRYLVENPGTTEGRMKGMLELSKQMGGGPTKAARAEQTDLLKGTDWDQTFNKEMIAVADLADEVSTLLKREKKLFAMADANSAALEAKGSRIDKVSAQQIAEANTRAIEFFQRTWMETGPIRDLLNEGGTRVAGGENKAAIAKQIKNRLVGQLGDLMGEEAVVRADVVQEDLLAQAPQQLDELMPEDRQAMEMLAIQRAIQNGEVRPPETPIPELPADSGVDLLKVERDIANNTITDDTVKAMDDELRLRDEFSELDDTIARETEKAARDEMGYDLMTFDEKKKAGLLEGVEEPAPAPRAAARFSFPPDISKSAPRYGMAKVEFASDFDRAAYMLRDATKKSKGEDRLIAALEQAGYDVADVRAHGEKVKQALKQAAVDQTGSARAPQSAATLQVPEQGFGVEGPAPAPRATMSATGPGGVKVPQEKMDEWLFNPDGWAQAAIDRMGLRNKPPSQLTKTEQQLIAFAGIVRRQGGEAKLREAWLDQIELRLGKEAASAKERALEGWLGTYVEARAARLAEAYTEEALTAIKEAARVSGIDPERIKLLDRIDMTDTFGADESYLTARAWRPAMARIIDQRPDSAAAKYLTSRTAGLRVPALYPGPLADSILLSLELQLGKAFGQGRLLTGRRGRSMVGDAYHEAFHRLQEFFFQKEKTALQTVEAKEEMLSIIKKGGGNYQEGMDIMEIQAEAFAVWALRRFKARTGSIVQRVFSQMNELVNAAGTAIRLVKGKPLMVTDIFEASYRGDIAQRSQKRLQAIGLGDLVNLASDVDSTLARLRPDIGRRIQAEIDSRYAEVEKGLDDWGNRATQEGC